MSHGSRDDRGTANQRLGPQFSDPRPADPPPPPVNPPEKPADPPPAEKPLTDAEVIRLRVLRAMPAFLLAAEAEEMKGLVAREHVEPAPLEPLTDSEAKRLEELSMPRTMTEAETAEAAALAARANVPRPVHLTPEDRAAHLFDAVDALAGVVAALADMVPAGHSLATRLRAVYDHIDVLRRADAK